MTERDRFLGTMRYQDVDRRPLHLVGPWADTLERWYGEGLPRGRDVHEYLGVTSLRTANLCGISGIHPPYTTRTIEETATYRISLDEYGRKVRTFKNHTSMPEWIEFPVKTAEDLRRLLDEHFDVEHMDERFPPEWLPRVQKAAAGDAVNVIDGGCYYWTLRSVAGVDGAAYLLYVAPDLVDELFERYFTVVMEGMRRAYRFARIDVVGFGEDIAFKTGPLMSPAMFRRFILPRYAKIQDIAA